MDCRIEQISYSTKSQLLIFFNFTYIKNIMIICCQADNKIELKKN